mmetsp:Transcript_27957/g.45027  ORF Transcript_27957/g.45027 Transcript_27957/m.45027 type:complete len:109 (-) Transcript_27957:133-459(-)
MILFTAQQQQEESMGGNPSDRRKSLHVAADYMCTKAGTSIIVTLRNTTHHANYSEHGVHRLLPADSTSSCSISSTQMETPIARHRSSISNTDLWWGRISFISIAEPRK